MDSTKVLYESDFEKWLSNQSDWLKDAIWSIYNGEAIDDKKINQYLDYCLNQVNKIDNKYSNITDISIIFKKSEEKMSIKKLYEIKNVNVLSENAYLEFNETGVNIIYGLNGSGKSSFMRIFKKLSGSPFKEELKTNVYKKEKSNKQSCKIDILHNEDNREIEYDLGNNNQNQALHLIDVFDTRISYEYLTKENNVSYQPFIFSAMSELAMVADRIKEYANYQIDKISPTMIEIPEEFVHLEDVKWIKEINYDTIYPEKYKYWKDEYEKEITLIKHSLDDENQRQKMETLEADLRVLEPILDDLDNAQKELQKYNFNTIKSQYFRSESNVESANILFSDSATDLDKISIQVDNWKLMWKSAKSYYEDYMKSIYDKDFAEEGSVCPLCHQDISSNVLERYKSIDNYINSNFQSEYEKCKKNIVNIIKKLSDREFNSQQISNLLIGKINEENITTLTDLYKKLEILEKLDVTNDDLKIFEILENLSFNNHINILKVPIQTTKDSIKQIIDTKDEDNIKKIKDRLLKLELFKWIHNNRETINLVIENKNIIKQLEDAKKLTSTNSITKQANNLADSLITDSYIERFNDEMRKLAPRLKVKLERGKSKKGTTPFKVSVDSVDGKKHKVEEVLSEGEQRIVALATFFADATGRNDKTPIIIDDPISSLDIIYEEKATERILELAKNRQVIVFTHRTSFLRQLGEIGEKIGVLQKNIFIRSGQNGKGIKELEGKFNGRIKQSLNELLTIIQCTRRDYHPDSIEYKSSIDSICTNLRIYTEYSVELVLLNDIVGRDRRDVKTKGKVEKLHLITEEDCAVIDDMMSKYSFTEHSQPLDSNPIEFSLDDIEKDVEKFKAWVEKTTKRNRS